MVESRSLPPPMGDRALMLKTLAVSNYRSLREIALGLGRLTVVTGPNGSGKSNLYRALRLLAAAGRGAIVGQLAREGGLPSTLWAGPEAITSAMRSGRQPVPGTVRKHPVGLKLGFACDDFGYSIELGLPEKSDEPSGFELDPVIKRECIWSGEVFRPASLLVDRRGPGLRTMDDAGRWQVRPGTFPTFESMMTEYVDLQTAPELVTMRARLRSWRFYDHFRTDLDAPARKPQIGTHTPVLSDDGSDLAAAVQTIRVIGDGSELDDAIDDAFPGSRIEMRPASR
jgi:predicted ATPase